MDKGTPPVIEQVMTYRVFETEQEKQRLTEYGEPSDELCVDLVIARQRGWHNFLVGGTCTEWNGGSLPKDVKCYPINYQGIMPGKQDDSIIPHWASNVDEALTLIEDGWDVQLKGTIGNWWAFFEPKDGYSTLGQGAAPTLALAICRMWLDWHGKQKATGG